MLIKRFSLYFRDYHFFYFNSSSVSKFQSKFGVARGKQHWGIFQANSEMKMQSVALRNAAILLVFSSIVLAQSDEPEFSPDDESKEFITKKHHQGYRSYYVLKPKQARPSYGVWYPSQHQQQQQQPQQPQTQQQPQQRFPPQQVVPNTRSGLKLPRKLGQIGAYRLEDLIQKAELKDYFEGQRRFTMFAPTDEAIRAFLARQPEGFAEQFMDNPEAIEALVKNHVVPGAFMSTDLVDGMTITNEAGNTVDVFQAKDGVMLIGGARLLNFENRVNFQAENGYIHMIDDVIFPFAADEAEEEKPKSKRYIQDKFDFANHDRTVIFTQYALCITIQRLSGFFVCSFITTNNVHRYLWRDVKA